MRNKMIHLQREQEDLLKSSFQVQFKHMVYNHEDWCRHLFNQYSRSYGVNALKIDQNNKERSKRVLDQGLNLGNSLEQPELDYLNSGDGQQSARDKIHISSLDINPFRPDLKIKKITKPEKKVQTLVNGFGTIREIENMEKHALIQEVYSLRKTVQNLNKQIKELKIEISENSVLQPSARKLLVNNSGIKSFGRTPPKNLPNLGVSQGNKPISQFDIKDNVPSKVNFSNLGI
jgi:hypothetical protein